MNPTTAEEDQPNDPKRHHIKVGDQAGSIDIDQQLGKKVHTPALQDDVARYLEITPTLSDEAISTLTAIEFREDFSRALAGRPSGPDWVATSDGHLPGPAGQLRYRTYRLSDEPAPLVLYLHGGGWVLGSIESDDPLCRDLCARTGAVIVSVEYRLAPENPFPAAVTDGQVAARWIADHASSLGGIPGGLIVAGASAGANIAGAVAQLATQTGHPKLLGQVLLCPVVDLDFTRRSYEEHGHGLILTAAVMKWFWSQYVPNEKDRDDARVALLEGQLRDLPPTVIVTSEFDPLRDEGREYALALSDAGVDVHYIEGVGQIHDSLGLVDVILSTDAVRGKVAEAIRGWFDRTFPTSSQSAPVKGSEGTTISM